MTSKHLWGTGLLGASLLGLVVIAWTPPNAPVFLAAGALQGRDSVRDSLLVSDSIYQGWKWFHVYCFRCHGEDAVGGINPAAPDLRWVLHPTGRAVPRDSFVSVTLNGRLDKGMPAWKVMLDTGAVKQLYLYVKARSDSWLKPGRPHRESDLKKSE